MDTLDIKLDKAEAMIAKPSFRENKGLGNEVGYYIFDYPAEQELYVRERIEYIRKKNEDSTEDFKVNFLISSSHYSGKSGTKPNIVTM